jgi:hypothetical protein
MEIISRASLEDSAFAKGFISIVWFIKRGYEYPN